MGLIFTAYKKVYRASRTMMFRTLSHATARHEQCGRPRLLSASAIPLDFQKHNSRDNRASGANPPSPARAHSAAPMRVFLLLRMRQPSDLAIAADVNLAHSHLIQRVSSTDKNGKPIDLTALLTRGYHKITRRWLIEHEHVSVPVDLDTDRPDLASKP